MTAERRGFDRTVPPPEVCVTTSLAVLLALSILGLLGALAVLTRGSGPARLRARVTVPVRASRARRRR